MTVIVLVVDGAPDVETMFRRQFRRLIRRLPTRGSPDPT
jgi:hypothetical protein